MSNARRSFMRCAHCCMHFTNAHAAFEINQWFFLNICSRCSWNLSYFIPAFVTVCLLQADPSKGHTVPLCCQELSHITFLHKYRALENAGQLVVRLTALVWCLFLTAGFCLPYKHWQLVFCMSSVLGFLVSVWACIKENTFLLLICFIS